MGYALGLPESSDTILEYSTARKQIYIPAYMWVLENKLQNEMILLSGLLNETKKISLIDFETNDDVNDIRAPLAPVKFTT